MSLSLVVGNLASWALQALLLIAVTGAVLALLRVTDPRLRLRTWHGILGAALLLPFCSAGGSTRPRRSSMRPPERPDSPGSLGWPRLSSSASRRAPAGWPPDFDSSAGCG